MIENGCYHYKNCDDCDFEDCRVVKLQNTIKKQKLKLFAKAYNQGRKETAERIIAEIKQSLNSVETIVGDTHKLQPDIGYSIREVDDLLDELAKQYGVEVKE